MRMFTRRNSISAKLIGEKGVVLKCINIPLIQESCIKEFHFPFIQDFYLFLFVLQLPLFALANTNNISEDCLNSLFMNILPVKFCGIIL